MDSKNSLVVGAKGALEKRAASQISIIKFAVLCIKKAWHTSWDEADWLTGLVGAALGAVAYFNPSWEAAVTHSLLIFPLAALASITVVRLVMSPLLVYRKLDVDSKIEKVYLRKELDTAVAEITRLKEKPDIHGEILVAFWEVYKDTSEMPWSKHSRYYIKLRLVNYNDVPCTVDRYSITVASLYDNTTGEGEGKPSSIGKLSHPTYNFTDENTEIVQTSTTRDTYTWVNPINITTQWPLARGRKQEGWVTFDVWNFKPSPVNADDVAPETFLGHWQECISISVVDSLGNTHTITNILADVAPARFQRN